jgi:hypothetical protein
LEDTSGNVQVGEVRGSTIILNGTASESNNGCNVDLEYFETATLSDFSMTGGVVEGDFLGNFNISGNCTTEGSCQLLFKTQGVRAKDSDQDGIADVFEEDIKTYSTKTDSDSDGLPDGTEDANLNARVDAGETNPADKDSDDDYYCDGEELGVTDLQINCYSTYGYIWYEPSKITDPLNSDTDGDGFIDSQDDLPLDPDEVYDWDGDGIGDGKDEDDDNDGIFDSEDPTAKPYYPAPSYVRELVLNSYSAETFVVGSNDEIIYEARTYGDIHGTTLEEIEKFTVPDEDLDEAAGGYYTIYDLVYGPNNVLYVYGEVSSEDRFPILKVILSENRVEHVVDLGDQFSTFLGMGVLQDQTILVLRSGEIIKVHPDGTQESWRSEPYTSITVDDNFRVWVGSGDSVMKLDDQGNPTVYIEGLNSLPDELDYPECKLITDIEVDPVGNFYVLCKQGTNYRGGYLFRVGSDHYASYLGSGAEEIDLLSDGSVVVLDYYHFYQYSLK